MDNRPLGRRPPTDDDHVRKYPLTVAALPILPVPVVAGFNWYTSFDNPIPQSNPQTGRLTGRWWIGYDVNALGRIRGGHCVCIKPQSLRDLTPWWMFYDQGAEGACVGFGSSRAMTLLNRRRYDARWLYHEAQKIDEWSGEDYEGTSVRAGMDVLRDVGHRRIRGSKTDPANTAEGISANRWATSVDEIRTCLQSPYHDELDGVPILNSWGRDYPRTVWMPYETLDRLLREDGEFTIVTDR
jgi:hypothetical protein